MSNQSRKRSAGGSGPGRGFYLAIPAIVVVGIAALLLARSGDTGPTEIPASLAETEADASAGVSAGPEDAVVTLVEFADFQCPACAAFYGFSGRLIKQNYVDGGGSVRWVFYDYPLEQHPHAIPAALAARCAGEQGRFWQMHDLMFARQSQWSPKDDARGDFEEMAEEIGLDRGAYRECVRDGRYLEQIFASAKYGQRLGVNSTPTLFVNGQRAPQDYEELERMILEAAAAAEANEEAGTEGMEGTGPAG
ncbi:MAG: thioredoxin domain-containing protein [Gemmatimonadales bacterium]|jgi:protein-disulfide isomerase